jgi:hypothetical protein
LSVNHRVVAMSKRAGRCRNGARFLHPELLIERYRRRVLEIRLHKYDIGVASAGFRSQCLDRSCRNTATAISLVDSKIVDIDLASILFELIQLVRRQTAYDKFVNRRSDGDEVRPPSRLDKYASLG